MHTRERDPDRKIPETEQKLLTVLSEADRSCGISRQSVEEVGIAVLVDREHVIGRHGDVVRFTEVAEDLVEEGEWLEDAGVEWLVHVPGAAHHELHAARDGTGEIPEALVEVVGVKEDDGVLLSSHIEILEVGIADGTLQVLQGLLLLPRIQADVLHTYHDDPLDAVGRHVALHQSDPVQQVLKLNLRVIEHGAEAEGDDVNGALSQEEVDAPAVHLTGEHAYDILLVCIGGPSRDGAWGR